MSKLVIVCVEDEAEVRDAVIRDLAIFKPVMRIEAAENAEDAESVLAECAADGIPVALILCDHLMPGMRGVDFLIKTQANPAYAATRKVLITGQAGLEDTVRAVNEAHLHHYVAKPWQPEQLQQVVRDELTEYVLQVEEDVMPYLAVLDSARLLDRLAHSGRDF
jgi:two-component system, OmpR family, phosphate regulon response regulator PhoB